MAWIASASASALTPQLSTDSSSGAGWKIAGADCVVGVPGAGIPIAGVPGEANPGVLGAAKPGVTVPEVNGAKPGVTVPEVNGVSVL